MRVIAVTNKAFVFLYVFGCASYFICCSFSLPFISRFFINCVFIVFLRKHCDVLRLNEGAFPHAVLMQFLKLTLGMDQEKKKIQYFLYTFTSFYSPPCFGFRNWCESPLMHHVAEHYIMHPPCNYSSLLGINRAMCRECG